MKNLKYMFIRVSENCNSRCFMCGFAGKHDSYNLTDEKFENLLSLMKKEGTFEVVRFTGGEPMMHPHLAHFIKRCKEEGYKTSIISNCYLLPMLYKNLCDAGLDQIIVSLDGATREVHDSLRNFNGCFDNIKNGIALVKKEYPNVKIRVNTVVSGKNIETLEDMLDLLIDWGVDAWSLIPLRSPENSYKDKIESCYKIYEKFKQRVENIEKPKMLGFCKQWAGRTPDEMKNLFENNKPYRPNGKCRLVERVRFYIPNPEMIVPCNCAAHRVEQISINKKKFEDLEKDAENMQNWLQENGPSVCTGCEPLNVFMAENPDCIDEDLFAF